MTRVRLADLARTAGVSQGTASNVFNRPELVRPDLRAHVERCARELNYHGPDPAARMLRAGKVNAIGVVAPMGLTCHFTDPYLRRFLVGVAEVCSHHGVGLSIVPPPEGAPPDGAPRDGTQASWTIRSAIVDGFVLHCARRDDPVIALAQRRNLPFVVVDSSPSAGVNEVRIENEDGAFLAARHLLELGHRDMAIFSIPLVHDGRSGWASLSRQAEVRSAVAGERMAGYRRAVAEAGMDPFAVPVIETTNEADGVRTALDELMAYGLPMPTGILAMSDVIAMTLLEELASRGIRVPEEVSVIGFDGLHEAAQCQPALTTVMQPIELKGRRAAEMIFDRAEGRCEVLEVLLEVRGSTAAPRR